MKKLLALALIIVSVLAIAAPALAYDPDGYDAVSYTHLDVYKRQLFLQAVPHCHPSLFSSFNYMVREI